MGEAGIETRPLFLGRPVRLPVGPFGIWSVRPGRRRALSYVAARSFRVIPFQTAGIISVRKSWGRAAWSSPIQPSHETRRVRGTSAGCHPATRTETRPARATPRAAHPRSRSRKLLSGLPRSFTPRTLRPWRTTGTSSSTGAPAKSSGPRICWPFSLTTAAGQGALGAAPRLHAQEEAGFPQSPVPRARRRTRRSAAASSRTGRVRSART
jgi:hypothetical protein